MTWLTCEVGGVDVVVPEALDKEELGLVVVEVLDAGEDRGDVVASGVLGGGPAATTGGRNDGNFT